MTGHVIKPLSPETRDADAALIEKHNSVLGGCWCSWFHLHTPENPKMQLGGPAFKLRMVERGNAQDALVFDSNQTIG